jgi:hypothetical protein
MASDLSLTLNYDNEPPTYRRGADVTLGVAKNLLKLIEAIDKQQNGKRTIIWDVNIYSFSDHAVIELTAVGDKKAGHWLRETMKARGIADSDIRPPEADENIEATGIEITGGVDRRPEYER